jgi:hypothetical protein
VTSVVLQDDEHSPVVLIDGVVHRRARWWTPAVHDLLSYLSGHGYSWAPVPLGRDIQGRERLSYIDGDCGRDAGRRVANTSALANFAGFLRTFHDAVRGYRPPPGAEWAIPAATDAPATGICHGDFAPWNIVWSGDDPVGLVDFDLANRGPAWHDVAYALAYSVPFRDDSDTKRILGVDEVPDRRNRVGVFADAYGVSVDGLVDQVVARQQKYARDVELLRDRGLKVGWTSPDSIGRNHQIASWLTDHRHLFQ